LEGWGEERKEEEGRKNKRTMRGAAGEKEEKEVGSVIVNATDRALSFTPRRRRLVLELSYPLGSAACLSGPTGAGFGKLCEESFQGKARLVASVMRGGGVVVVVREMVVERVAFELGGTMRCEGKCENEMEKGERMEGGGVAEEIFAEQK